MLWIRLEIEMPLEKRPAQDHRGSPAAAARRPFHLRLPDVFGDQKPQATPGPQRRPPRQAVASAPTARAPAQSTRTQLSEKRYQDGHQQVTGMIERMRERRRKLLGRLWVASIALTALSIVALAIELIQGVQSPIATRAAIPKGDQADTSRSLARKTSSSPARPVSGAAAREWSNESPDDQPVKSALYTTEDGPKPMGAWLDGLIIDPDSDSEWPSPGVQHDDHQSRTR